MNLRKYNRATVGTTLVEMMMSLGIFLVAGAMIYTALNSTTVLYAKNTAINLAHGYVLKSLEHITRDIHASASTPQLVDVNRAVTTGPAAGILVQPVSAGPYATTSMTMLSGSGTLTIITGNDPAPQVGQRVVCPSCLVEDYIVAVAPNGATQTDLTTATSVWTAASIGTNLYYPAFITHKAAYVVVGTELRYYPNSTGSSNDAYVVLAWEVTTPTPFNIVTTPAGSPTNKTVAVTMTVNDPTFNRRGYRVTDMSVNFRVPYRSQLAVYP